MSTRLDGGRMSHGLLLIVVWCSLLLIAMAKKHLGFVNDGQKLYCYFNSCFYLHNFAFMEITFKNILQLFYFVAVFFKLGKYNIKK